MKVEKEVVLVLKYPKRTKLICASLGFELSKQLALIKHLNLDNRLLYLDDLLYSIFEY